MPKNPSQTKKVRPSVVGEKLWTLQKDLAALESKLSATVNILASESDLSKVKLHLDTQEELQISIANIKKRIELTQRTTGYNHVSQLNPVPVNSPSIPKTYPPFPIPLTQVPQSGDLPSSTGAIISTLQTPSASASGSEQVTPASTTPSTTSQSTGSTPIAIATPPAKPSITASIEQFYKAKTKMQEAVRSTPVQATLHSKKTKMGQKKSFDYTSEGNSFVYATEVTNDTEFASSDNQREAVKLKANFDGITAVDLEDVLNQKLSGKKPKH